MTTPSSSSFDWRFLAPHNWLLGLGLGLMKLMTLLPLRWQLTIGECAGRWLGKLARRRRRIAQTNLALCFPEMTPNQRAQLLDAHFAALGAGLFETAMAWWANDEQVRCRVRFNGEEYLQQAMAAGKGVILLTGHFTTLELGARFMTLLQPFHAMYRPHKNPLYESAQRRQREWRCQLPPLAREDLRGVLRALKQGRAIWYAPDQNHGLRHSVFAPFFGIPACTITATSRLAALSGAAVVPYFPRRLAGNAGYEITILPALDYFPTDDPAADARRINALLEQQIRPIPEQYLWVHRRFKTRPPGSPGVYHF